ncbi:MAG TPA: molybdopterin molybdotransferase MoeA, partial [Burkholderiales bacterium]
MGSVPISRIVSCLDGYDPDALHVEKAREAMRACITPIVDTELVPVRKALGRVLAQEVVPAINVPAHDNSAMDGYAVRFADLDQPLQEIGSALAGKPFAGRVGPGQCVRVMTGAVMPAGSDTVVIQEVVKKEGERIVVPPGQKRAQNVRYAGEDLKIGVPVLSDGQYLRPAELGLIASLGIGEVRVKRRLRVAFFSTGDELASIGTALKEGERIVVPPGQKRAQNVRYAGEDLKIGVPVLSDGQYLRPAELGLIASLGIGEVRVKRRLRVAFFSTGDELASIGTALKEG